jgi:hypothetical protein
MIKTLRSKEYKELTKKETVVILYDYLKEQEDLLIREMYNQDSFNKSSWAEYQAYKLGMLKAFSKVVDFLPDQGDLID